MICASCGHRDIEAGEHRCPHCGRRLDRLAPERPGAAPEHIADLRYAPPAATPSGPHAQAAAAAPLPEWRRELAGRLELFQHKRARQRGLFDEPLEEKEEAVPPPDPTQKVVAFEDFAAQRIEPLVVEPPRPEPAQLSARPRPAEPPWQWRAQQRPAAELASHIDDVDPEPEHHEPAFPRDILCPFPVAPLALRGLAGALDLAVGVVAAGIFWSTFHLLGGAFHLNQKAIGGAALASAVLVAFYFFVYTCYGAETPGLQWIRLRVLDYDGNPPQPGQRLVRSIGIILSGAALGLGYLWSLIDEEGLTWHDRMSKTFVTSDPGVPLKARRPGP